MNHTDHVALLRDGIRSAGGIWADLGSGTGTFTLALADLIGPGGEIYSIDRDQRALQAQERTIRARFPDVIVHYWADDFTRRIDVPPLNGVVMANSLHFIRDKIPVLHLIQQYLQPGAPLLLVEYNTDAGNLWVPHPLSYATWEILAAEAGFINTHKMHSVPSSFLDEIYSAASETAAP